MGVVHYYPELLWYTSPLVLSACLGKLLTPNYKSRLLRVYGCAFQELGTTEFTNLIGRNGMILTGV